MNELARDYPAKWADGLCGRQIYFTVLGAHLGLLPTNREKTVNEQHSTNFNQFRKNRKNTSH